MQYHFFFASCSKGLESLLEQELLNFQPPHACTPGSVKQTVAGVFFSGSLHTAYRAIMFSRLANRIVLLLQQAPVQDAQDLYRVSRAINWREHLSVEQTFAISAAGSTPQLNHTQFIAQKIKDAIVDQFREQGLPRPDVSRTEPDVPVHAVIKQDKLMLGIDLAGESLHRRHYRTEQGEAPLKETLAAAILMRAGWPTLSREPGSVLCDPMCGSGTLIIEGVLMALDIAPGLLRGMKLSGWLQHDRQALSAVIDEAEALRAASSWSGRAIGSDRDARTIGIATRNAERAKIADKCSFSTMPLTEATVDQPTVVVCNPPYAERLGDEPEVAALYEELGAFLRREASGARAAIITARPDWGRLLGIHSHKQYAFFNGALPAKLLLFNINEDTIYKKPDNPPASSQPPQGSQSEALVVAEPLDSGAQMFANRLRKNLKSIGKWAQQEGHQCYRLYDADMPEYAFAIDLYADRVHMQEYKAPMSVSEESASLRRRQAFQAVRQVLQIPAERISLKVRERQKGKEQYRPAPKMGEDFVVEEGAAKFWVNLERYLDTGLFLDHRPIRRYVHEHARGKRFLNLFCYTGSVTVQAALGGASRSMSVDLSKTYLQWAARNLELNSLSTTQHELVQMDCLRFLKQCRETFDLIFLDPPTFSNSKSTDHVLDVQRDHGELIALCMQSLSPNGLLIFSTNHRRFRLDPDIQSRFQVEDRSRESLDRDFARNTRIHQVWFIRGLSH